MLYTTEALVCVDLQMNTPLVKDKELELEDSCENRGSYLYVCARSLRTESMGTGRARCGLIRDKNELFIQFLFINTSGCGFQP